MNTKKTSKNIFMYIKMSRTLSAKYYQENKERLPKKAREICQNLFKEEKTKKRKKLKFGRERISQKIKNKILLIIEKKIL